MMMISLFQMTNTLLTGNPFAKDPIIEKQLRAGMRNFKAIQAILKGKGFKQFLVQDHADKYCYKLGELSVFVSFASGRWFAYNPITDEVTARGMTVVEFKAAKVV